MAMMMDVALRAGAKLVTRNGKRFAVFHENQCIEHGVKSFSRVYEEIPQFPGQFFESPILTRTSATTKMLKEKNYIDISKKKFTTTRTNKGVFDILTSSNQASSLEAPYKVEKHASIKQGYTPASQVDYLTLDHIPMFLEKEGGALGSQNKLQTFLKQFLGI